MLVTTRAQRNLLAGLQGLFPVRETFSQGCRAFSQCGKPSRRVAGPGNLLAGLQGFF